MFDIFDISALTLASIGVFCFKRNKNNLIILFNLLCFNVLNLIDFTEFGVYYYTVITIVELSFIGIGLIMNVKSSILIIFLISLSYNALSSIEYNTNFSFIYDNYALVMQSLIISLVFLIYKNGFEDGINNDHNANDHNNTSDYSRIFCRGSQ